LIACSQGTRLSLDTDAAKRLTRKQTTLNELQLANMVKRQANGDKKKKVNKKALFLKMHDIKRPLTGFQLWKASIKDTLKADIEAGKAPQERAAAFEASLTDKGRYDLTRYSGLLWRSKEDGGVGYVSDKERAEWDAKYQEAKADWQAQRDKVLEEFPSRPPSAYLLFYTKDFQKEYQHWHPDATMPNKAKPTVAEIAKAASQVWSEKKDSKEFAKYFEEAAALKEAHEEKKQRFEEKYGDKMRELIGENDEDMIEIGADEDEQDEEEENNEEQEEEEAPPAKRARKAAPKKKATTKAAAAAPKKAAARAATKKVTAKQAAAQAAVATDDNMEQDEEDEVGSNVKAAKAAAPKKKKAAPKRKRVVADTNASVAAVDEE